MKKSISSKYYWIGLSEWSLKSLFIDECIAPVSWYDIRGFGSKSIRNEVFDDAFDYILLHNSRPFSEYSLKVDSTLIETSKIRKSLTKNGPLGYNASIYLVPGLVEIYFNSRDTKNSFSRRSRMILEMKPLSKWERSMIVKLQNEINTGNSQNTQFDLSFTQSDDAIGISRNLNSLKGGFYCVMYGVIQFESKSTMILKQIRGLKNRSVGLHTSISLYDKSEDLLMLDTVDDWRLDLESLKRVLLDDFERLLDVLITRSNSVKSFFLELRDLKNRENINNSDEVFRLRSQIEQLEFELKSIKNEEKANGEKIGKSRLYFKKGSERYLQKCQIKDALERIKKENPQMLTYSQDNLEVKLSAAINEQFWSISTVLSKIENELVINQATFFKSLESCLKGLRTKINEERVVIFSAQSIADLFGCTDDIERLEIILDALSYNHRGWSGDKSNDKLLQLVEFVGSRLEGEVQKECFRNFFRYKRGDTANFDFTENLVLNSFFAFLLKPYDFQSLNKYCLGKDEIDSRLAFLFFGLYNGFSSLPANLIARVFDNDEQFLLSDTIDSYINELHMNMLSGS